MFLYRKTYNLIFFYYFYIQKHIKMNLISDFVKKRRKLAGLTQEEFAMKAGVALTVIRKIEQGKDNLSLSKVNQVLKMFGHTVGPIEDK